MHPEGITKTYVAAPVISAVSNVINGVQLKWAAVLGTEQYCILRKGPGDSSYIKIGETTGTTYLDETAESGEKYNYIVRCETGEGAALSANSTAKTKTYISAPVLINPTIATGKARARWNAVEGAVKYRVLRKTGSGSWTRLGETTATNFLDTTVKAGTKYTYSVYCITANGTRVSAYDTVGKTITAK